jgi:hypothetical protein
VIAFALIILYSLALDGGNYTPCEYSARTGICD